MKGNRRISHEPDPQDVRFNGAALGVVVFLVIAVGLWLLRN